jgi:hypothetical protein
MFVFVQIGDGTTTHRYSPVSVVALSSGVAMVVLGFVSCGWSCFVVYICDRVVLLSMSFIV